MLPFVKDLGSRQQRRREVEELAKADVEIPAGKQILVNIRVIPARESQVKEAPVNKRAEIEVLHTEFEHLGLPGTYTFKLVLSPAGLSQVTEKDLDVLGKSGLKKWLKIRLESQPVSVKLVPAGE